MASSLCVHTSEVATKVAYWTCKEPLRPQARKLRLKQREGYMQGMKRLGWWWGLAMSLTSLFFFFSLIFFPCPSFPFCLFPLLNIASGHSPPQKAGKWVWHFNPPPPHLFYPSTQPSVFIQCTCADKWTFCFNANNNNSIKYSEVVHISWVFFCIHTGSAPLCYSLLSSCAS